MDMKRKHGLFILGLTIYCILFRVPPCFGQDTFLCKGIIKEGDTKEPLQNVRIFVDGDTIGVKNDIVGKYQITVKKGSKVRFKKTGYVWQSIIIAGKEVRDVELFPSLPKGKGNRTNEFGEIIVDGKSLLEDEWNDINPVDIIDISINRMVDGKAGMSIVTK